ncbi:MAG: hypothetical protein ABSF80_01320 [Chitinispirillaceae bacterium]|jgi:hypothetical protein
MIIKRKLKIIIILSIAFASITSIYIFRYAILAFLFGILVCNDQNQQHKRLLKANYPLILHECDSLRTIRNKLIGDISVLSQNQNITVLYLSNDNTRHQIPNEIKKLHPFELYIADDNVKIILGNHIGGFWIEAFPKGPICAQDSILIPNLWLRER